MLMFAIKATTAVSENRKVTTNTLTRANFDMRVWTSFSSAATFVDKVDAKRRPFRCRFVGEVAGFTGVGTSALKERPANSNLVGIVLVHAGKPSSTGSCEKKRKTVENLSQSAELSRFVCLAARGEEGRPVDVNRGHGFSEYLARLAAMRALDHMLKRTSNETGACTYR